MFSLQCYIISKQSTEKKGKNIGKLKFNKFTEIPGKNRRTKFCLILFELYYRWSYEDRYGSLRPLAK